MSNYGVEQIVIRHLSGSKANQIEHISLAGLNEITIGRDPRSNIAFGSSRDDIVSRRHAVIRVVRGDQISFRLADLGSNNGTFLNGKQIKEEEELLPEDSIGLGKNGLTFVFDVQPRPAYLGARTRVIDISDAAATRVVETAGIATRDAGLASEMSIQKFEQPPKMGEGVEQIVIRHLSGSKANQFEHISLAGLNEIAIGRDPKSNIAFDSSRDDIVSRRHAVIRVVRGDQISFRLADLGSNNGTFLNGRQIKEEEELLPEDSIGLGKNGLKFVFDVQPRPAYLVARTRVIDISDASATRVIDIGDAAATRVIETAGIAARDPGLASEMSIQKFEQPPKVGVGKETVIHLLGEERRATSRVWIASLAGFAAFVALGGGAIYWKQVHDKTAEQAEMRNDIAEGQASIASKVTSIESKVTEQQADLLRKTEEDRRKTDEDRPLSAQDIFERFGSATSKIDRAWRLYDQKTGKPVFHQTMIADIGKGKNKESLLYPAYVRLPGERGIVRWLTLEDDDRTNIPIGGEASGTGFVVDEQGFMLTNKHVAAAWNLDFGETDPANSRYGYGWLYEYNGGPRAKDRRLRTPTRIDLSDREFADLKDWVPSSGGYVFLRGFAHVGGPGNTPDARSGDTKTFFGRNDKLEVRFANSRISANAILERVSEESDAALIKVDTPQQLKKLDIAGDDTVTVGEPVIVLGYPSVARETKVTSTTVENGKLRQNTDVVPIPFVTEGIVALVSPGARTENGVTVTGEMGDVIQMSINSTGAGNSGGPVFNKAGKVIGLFTYGISSGGANTSGAIPIKYGRDLLRAQQP